MAYNKLPPLETLENNFRYDEMSGVLYRKYKNIETTTTKNRKTGYYWVGFNYKKYASHRIIWKLYYKKDVPCDMEIDHINGDKSDNRVSNLRLVTMNQNMMNKKKYSSNQSGIVGVAKRSDTNSWRAQISVNGKAIKLGSFKTREEAINARLAAENKYGFHINHGAR
jgi:hypothetical protein